MSICLLAVSSLAQASTASLAGRVTDLTGAGLSGVSVELRSERAQNLKYRGRSDSTGTYGFSGLPADEYTLKLSLAGFNSLTVKSVHIAEGEQKSLPTLELTVGSVADCGGHAVLDYVRVLLPQGHSGNLGGSVVVDRGPLPGKSAPVSGAEAALICTSGKTCGATKTDSDGQFIFRAIPPGKYSVRITATGYYQLTEPDYQVEGGLESIYWPVPLECCRAGNCDPRLRPKKPIITCE